MHELEQLRRSRARAANDGQGLVEYALILFLIAVIVTAILILLGPQIGSTFSAINNSVT